MEKKDNFALTDAERAARREYQRRWRAKNPDKGKQYAKRRWAKAAAQMAAEAQEQHTAAASE